MKQVVIIHGGDSFSSYDAYLTALKTRDVDYDRLKYHQRWREWIAVQLPNDDVLLPTFPNGSNANYDEWAIYFKKLIPFLQDGYVLVGHSLGAMFLAKYLHEHILPSKARRIILVAAQHGMQEGDDVGSFAVTSASGVEQSTDEVHLFHSEDDPVVPYTSLSHMAADIPTATIHTYTDRGHFNDTTFPEILALLQQK